ncbi:MULTISPECIES: alpha/beta hydrolase family protein [Shinella]|uniref:Alpha/beta fold hydrolase n=1 Tax=Shinella sedimenti TaxID=2919913 RepID=A0ABT0CTE9_9HYPH|nr:MULTISPECIES: alpha/beta fold hydrolase [Shinella]MCJ8151827.1 alpha/beta fold hydrolase [Shinella sedimenti]
MRKRSYSFGMRDPSLNANPIEGQLVEFLAPDGLQLAGHLWQSRRATALGTVIVNPATGVLARYYHRYARFLAEHGFDVLTYDYRGIGLSRPASLRGCRYRWRDWGELDFEGAIRLVHEKQRKGRLLVVGHSFGGFLPGLAPSAYRIERLLTIGAQYAWWGDYAPHRRFRLFLKWHVAMPVLTMAFRYFPGGRLGWLEDLPAGVAFEWSFRRSCFERSHPLPDRQIVLDRIAAVTAPILAVVISDDDLGTPAAICRTLGYYSGAERVAVELRPSDYRRSAIGHFGLFHDSHASGFWLDTLLWLRDARNPWPDHAIYP